jgi:hypothetical protein
MGRRWQAQGDREQRRLWTTGEFVAGVDNPAYSIAFCGTAAQHGLGSWSVALANFSTQPPCSTPVATTSWGRIKILYR